MMNYKLGMEGRFLSEEGEWFLAVYKAPQMVEFGFALHQCETDTFASHANGR